MGVGKSRPRQSKSLNISHNPVMGECEFDTLFTRNVPHILEKIFFSLDYASFKNCLEVNEPWRDLLTSESFLRKGKSVFCEDIHRELRLGASSGNVDTIIRVFSSFKADVNLMTERNTNSQGHFGKMSSTRMKTFVVCAYRRKERVLSAKG